MSDSALLFVFKLLIESKVACHTIGNLHFIVYIILCRYNLRFVYEVTEAQLGCPVAENTVWGILECKFKQNSTSS